MKIAELKLQLETEIEIKLEELRKVGTQYREAQRIMSDIAVELYPVQEIIRLQYPEIADMLTELLQVRDSKAGIIEEIKKKYKDKK